MSGRRLTARDRAVFSSLLARDNFLLLIHRNPDGDALGSCMAFRRVLESLGKRVTCGCSTPVPERLRFLTDGAKELVPAFEPETVVTLDVATGQMLGETYQNYASRTDFVLDHHPTNSHYGKESIVLDDASATGEVLYRLFRGAGIRFDAQTASFLYAAIASDTGCFKYRNTSAMTHRIAAALYAYPIDFVGINRRLFDMEDEPHIRLEGMACERIRVFCNGEISAVTVTRQLLHACGVDENDCDGLVSVPRKIPTARIAVLLREMSNGTVRVSLRGEDDRVNVARIAARFGGGGHIKAAGCTLSCSPEEALQQILAAAQEEL